MEKLHSQILISPSEGEVGSFKQKVLKSHFHHFSGFLEGAGFIRGRYFTFINSSYYILAALTVQIMQMKGWNTGDAR